MKFCFEKKDFIDLENQPNKLAIIGDDFELTWSEFKKSVNTLCDFFEQNSINHLSAPVIIYGHKSTNMMVSIYAMMKLNITYIPVDINYPIDRISKVIKTSDCQLIINTTANKLNIDSVSEVQLSKLSITLDSNIDTYNLGLTQADPVIYVIFTSGSTGEPKGVQISTEAVQSFGRWMSSDDFKFKPSDVFVNTALLSFDLSVFEVMTFGYLGASIILNNKTQCSDPNLLMKRIESFNGSIWVSTPSFALTYSRIENVNQMDSIHTFLFCGEILPHPLAKKLLQTYNQAKVINTYGPTEATVATTVIEITDAILEAHNPLPVGKSKMESRLLFENDEIIIVGPNVSIGYVKNEKLNQDKFILKNNQRAFKTGDKGFLKDGLLFFNGRNDDLVKLHGYRIELNEITSVLDSLPYVLQAETIALKRNDVVKKIVSLVKLEPNQSVDKNSIKTDLAITLPNYMIPSDIKIINEFPLTQNGKIDKNLLTQLYLNR